VNSPCLWFDIILDFARFANVTYILTYLGHHLNFLLQDWSYSIPTGVRKQRVAVAIAFLSWDIGTSLWKDAICDFRLLIISFNIFICHIGKLEPENIDIAVEIALLSCIEADIWVLRFGSRYIWLPTSGLVIRHYHLSHWIVWPKKHGRWNLVSILSMNLVWLPTL